MKSIKELQKEMEAKFAEVEAAAKALEDAKGKEGATEEDIAVAQDVYNTVTKEYDEIESGRVEAKAYFKRQEALAEVKRLAQPADPRAAQIARQGFAPMPTVEAKAVDHAQEDQYRSKVFSKWATARCVEELQEISGEEAKLISPRGDYWKGQKGRQFGFLSAVVPPSMACKMMGANYTKTFQPEYYGKVVSSINNAVTNPSLANNLVPQEFVNRLLQLPAPRPSLLNRVTILPCQTGVLTLPQLVQTSTNEVGGIVMTWGTEGAAKGETEPLFGQIDITTYELNGYTAVTERVLSRSAIALEPLLTTLYRRAIGIEVDRVILNGTGAGQPTGIVGAAGVGTVGRTTAGTVTYADLVNLKHLLAFYHRANADWVLADGVEQALENLTETTGAPLFNASMAAGPYDRILGYPYQKHYSSPAIGTNGDVVFGDFSEYYMAVEEEIVVARSEHALFRNNQIAYKVYMVLGGLPANPRAFAYLVRTSGS